MFRRNTRWGRNTLKSLLIAGVLYRFARFFLKITDKQAGSDDRKKEKIKKAAQKKT
jgi:hypothetical protein